MGSILTAALQEIRAIVLNHLISCQIQPYKKTQRCLQYTWNNILVVEVQLILSLLNISMMYFKLDSN